jgi:hypothetical protein
MQQVYYDIVVFLLGDLSKNNHFITLQVDGHSPSPNLLSSNYITKTEKKWGIQQNHQLNVIQ